MTRVIFQDIMYAPKQYNVGARKLFAVSETSSWREMFLCQRRVPTSYVYSCSPGVFLIAIASSGIGIAKQSGRAVATLFPSCWQLCCLALE